MIHKARSGKLIICFECDRWDDCSKCVGNQMPDEVRCHCPKCQPPCEVCLSKPQAAQRKAKGTCPSCFVKLPLNGICDQCD